MYKRQRAWSGWGITPALDVEQAGLVPGGHLVYALGAHGVTSGHVAGLELAVTHATPDVRGRERPRQTVARQANDGLLPTLGRIGPREAFVFQRSSIEALAAERAGVKR